MFKRTLIGATYAATAALLTGASVATGDTAVLIGTAPTRPFVIPESIHAATRDSGEANQPAREDGCSGRQSPEAFETAVPVTESHTASVKVAEGPDSPIRFEVDCFGKFSVHKIKQFPVV